MSFHLWERIYAFLSFCINAYIWVIVIRALISWFNPNPYNPIIHFLLRITEPVLQRIRRLIPFSVMGGLDFAPLLLILLLWLLDAGLLRLCNALIPYVVKIG